MADREIMRSTKSMDNVKGVKFCMWASQKFVTFYCVCVCVCMTYLLCLYAVDITNLSSIL
jgi:hypothetical protein